MGFLVSRVGGRTGAGGGARRKRVVEAVVGHEVKQER